MTINTMIYDVCTLSHTIWSNKVVCILYTQYSNILNFISKASIHLYPVIYIWESVHLSYVAITILIIAAILIIGQLNSFTHNGLALSVMVASCL